MRVVKGSRSCQMVVSTRAARVSLNFPSEASRRLVMDASLWNSALPSMHGTCLSRTSCVSVGVAAVRFAPPSVNSR